MAHHKVTNWHVLLICMVLLIEHLLRGIVTTQPIENSLPPLAAATTTHPFLFCLCRRYCGWRVAPGVHRGELGLKPQQAPTKNSPLHVLWVLDLDLADQEQDAHNPLLITLFIIPSRLSQPLDLVIIIMSTIRFSLNVSLEHKPYWTLQQTTPSPTPKV